MRRKVWEKILPLLEVLKNLQPADRIIVLSHLDESTRGKLCQAVNYFLVQGAKFDVDKKTRLRDQLRPYTEDFRALSDSRKKKQARKKKTLLRIGGGPMTVVLENLIPGLLDLFSDAPYPKRTAEH